jgi:hypothetical protein
LNAVWIERFTAGADLTLDHRQQCTRDCDVLVGILPAQYAETPIS